MNINTQELHSFGAKIMELKTILAGAELIRTNECAQHNRLKQVQGKGPYMGGDREEAFLHSRGLESAQIDWLAADLERRQMVHTLRETSLIIHTRLRAMLRAVEQERGSAADSSSHNQPMQLPLDRAQALCALAVHYLWKAALLRRSLNRAERPEFAEVTATRFGSVECTLRDLEKQYPED